MTFEPRSIGNTGIRVTPVALGCWPISGISSVNVNKADSLATLQAAVDAGINFFDTAYCYGYEGESEKLIAEALKASRDDIVIATKAGLHWENRKQARDARPETIRRECEESLRRLGTDRVELYYLHAPDPNVPIAETAGAFRELRDAGKVLSVGVSNLNVAQHEEFHVVCPISASQPYYNMLQREIEDDVLPWCEQHNVSVIVYWPLMKGLLAGKLPRDHVFEPNDGRRKYPMFQGTEWEKNQDFLDRLREMAAEWNTSVAQIVINWTIQRPGITAALCGAKRPEQIRENAAAMNWKLSDAQIARLDAAIADRGPIVSRGPV